MTALDKDESAHALRVLRLKPGDAFVATDGQGSFYDCIVTNENRGVCHFEVKARRTIQKSTHQIHIAIAPMKNHDRLEWFVEKATEVGIDRITPMVCDRNERKKINHERLQKVAISAMKQSLKPWLPVVETLMPFNGILKTPADQRFVAHLDEMPGPHLAGIANKDSSSVTLIGPEGDFTKDEISAARDQGFQVVSLGPHRLRTETAALVACHALNMVNEVSTLVRNT